MNREYDVIIVGGRPSGASLACRLGDAGARVLLLDRARFPSHPAVSSPFLLPHAMELLDEIGAREEDYASPCVAFQRFTLEFGEYFRAFFTIGSRGGRDYLYMLDRAVFDGALWSLARARATVTAREGFAVRELARGDDGRVVGVIGGERDGEEQEFRAPLVVGADGRHSTIARKAGAAVTERREDIETMVYYAYWEGVAPYDDTGVELAQIHSTDDPWSIVFMPIGRGRESVLLQAPAGAFPSGCDDLASFYEDTLRRYPRAWRRLEGATRTSKLSGMKRVGNMFREPGRDGWALVGDAYHQKDSVDAQGIYDALLGAKLLAEELTPWRDGARDLDASIQAYGSRVYREMKPMFESTVARLKREIFGAPPPFIARTVLRWVICDPEYRRRFGELLVRTRDPAGWFSPGLIAGAIGRGIARDVHARLRGRPPPNTWADHALSDGSPSSS